MAPRRSPSMSASMDARYACSRRASGWRRASSAVRAISRRLPAPRSTGGCATSSAAWRLRPSDPSSPPDNTSRVLLELRVENLLLLDRAELRLGPGLNVVTGETGAGKTLLAHSLDLLLGGRARSGIVRSGAAEAYVEGIFFLPPALRRSEAIPSDAQEIVLARRVWPGGHTRPYVCGPSAT